MQGLLEFVKVLALGVAALFLLVIAYSIIQTFIDNIRKRNTPKIFYEKILPEILEEISKEEQQEKKVRKTARKPKKTKEKEKDEK